MMTLLMLAWLSDILKLCQADCTWIIKTKTSHSVLTLDIVQRTVVLNTTDGWQCVLRAV